VVITTLGIEPTHSGRRGDGPFGGGALASKKRRVVKGDFDNDCGSMFESAGGLKQNPARQCMATVQAVKVLLATCPRALLRSTLTAWTSAMERF